MFKPSLKPGIRVRQLLSICALSVFASTVLAQQSTPATNPAPKKSAKAQSAAVNSATQARKRGHALYNDGEFEQAFAAYRIAARKGDALAQFNLAMMHKNGEGTPANQAAAQYWLKRAAAKKEPNALFAMGTAYEDGVFGKKSLPLAARWYARAAHEGLADAQIALATAYLNGRGLKQSDELAAKWYLAAAFQGEVDAQYIVGTLYETGTGLKMDLGQATLWYRQAAAQGDIAARAKIQALSQ